MNFREEFVSQWHGGEFMLTCRAIVMLLSMILISSATVPVNARVNSRAIDIVQVSRQVRIAIGASRQAQPTVSALADGDYQFCSQPDPRDWRDGAGVCFNFTKKDRAIDGYYGYPHSDSFVCIQGQATGNSIVGKALALSWPGQSGFAISPAEFVWDVEGHLNLNQGEIRRQSDKNKLQESWIAFKTAKLNIRNFYRYRAPRMKPVTELCDWDG